MGVPHNGCTKGIFSESLCLNEKRFVVFVGLFFIHKNISRTLLVACLLLWGENCMETKRILTVLLFLFCSVQFDM